MYDKRKELVVADSKVLFSKCTVPRRRPGEYGLGPSRIVSVTYVIVRLNQKGCAEANPHTSWKFDAVMQRCSVQQPKHGHYCCTVVLQSRRTITSYKQDYRS